VSRRLEQVTTAVVEAAAAVSRELAAPQDHAQAVDHPQQTAPQQRDTSKERA
jgi:hypothetical protein